MRGILHVKQFMGLINNKAKVKIDIFKMILGRIMAKNLASGDHLLLEI